MPKLSEFQWFFGAWVCFAIWVFVVLPFLYGYLATGGAIMTLADAYYYSQIFLDAAAHYSPLLLAATAIMAASFGYRQLRASNRYELLKKLEDEQVRKARRLLWKELCVNEAQPRWWKDNVELEEAASTVCASFDIVGLMAKYGNYRFFSKEWAHAICWTYEALQEYIEERKLNNPRSYRNYCKLYERAKRSKLP